MPDVSALLFTGISDLVLGAVKKRVEFEAENFLTQIKIEQALKSAVRRVVVQLVPFLESERIGEEKQWLLVNTTLRELGLLIREPERLFRGSLDGQRVFDQLYVARPLPEELVQEDLGSVYAMIGPRIASLLCELPVVVEHWKGEKYREDYRRFDEVVGRLQAIADKVDAMAGAPAAAADEMLRRLRQALTQRLEMDLTGLRLDQPAPPCRFEDLFVHPELRRERGAGRQQAAITDENVAARAFLAPGRRAVLIGLPGAGKSTWTKWLARQALEESRALAAVRVELRRYAKEEPPPFQALIRQAAGTHLAENLDAERIRRWADGGKLAFLLDGFDELPPNRRDALHAWLEGLAREVGDCPVIVTSRPLTTTHLDTLGKTWKRWTVEPFDEPRIVRYIEQWYRHMPLLADAAREVDAQALASEWKTDPTIEPLTGNPLLLSTLLVVHLLDGRLPHGRAQLYRRYVEGMLGGWDDRRNVDAVSVQLKTHEKRRVLQGLALSMHLAELDQLDEVVTSAIVQDVLAELRVDAQPDAVLAALRERTGLLVGPGVYSFSHKSIAEFLVAEAIVEGTRRDAAGTRIDQLLLFRNRPEDRWNTVLFLWAGLAPTRDVEGFVEMCLKSSLVDDLSIAFGILYDQRERVSTTLQRDACLLALQKGGDWHESKIERVVCEPNIIEHGRLPLQRALWVRSVSSVYDAMVVHEWVNVGVLGLDDLKQAHPKVHDRFWLLLTDSALDLASWESCLMYLAARSNDERLANAVLSRALASSEWEPRVALDIFERVFPSLKGRVLFTALAGMLPEWRHGLRHDQRRYRLTYVRHMLVLLPALADGPVDEGWLRESCNFCMGLGSDGDILGGAISIIERDVSEGNIPADAIVDAALVALYRLKARRDELLLNASPEAAPNVTQT